MTAAVMELSYDLSAREKEKISISLGSLSLERKGVPLTNFSAPKWQVVIVLLLGFCVIPPLLDLVTAFIAGENLMQSYKMLDLLIGFVMTWIFVDSLLSLLGGALRWLRAEKFWREGLHWGKHRLTVTPEALSLQLAEFESVYRWPAFTALHKTKDMLLLTLTPSSAIAVPRRAFRSEAEATAFCDFVEAQIGVVS